MSGKLKLKNKKILILDDERAICELISDLLEDFELDITISDSVKEAKKLCKEKHFDLLILDFNVSDGVGWSLPHEVEVDPEKYGKPCCLYMSGTVDYSILADFPTKLRTMFIPKPFAIKDFREVVKKLLK